MGKNISNNFFHFLLCFPNRVLGVSNHYLCLDGLCVPVDWRNAVEDDTDHISDNYILLLPYL
jgi:hypothetical protein